MISSQFYILDNVFWFSVTKVTYSITSAIVGDQARVLAQHWCDDLDNVELGPFVACLRLFDERFDGVWTFLMVHEQEGAKVDRFGANSMRVVKGGKILCNRSIGLSRDSMPWHWSLEPWCPCGFLFHAESS